MADLIHTDIPRYKNFVRMPPAFFTSSKNAYTTKEVSHQYIRNPLEVGLKLAITLRHLATKETYTYLQYHWLVG